MKRKGPYEVDYGRQKRKSFGFFRFFFFILIITVSVSLLNEMNVFSNKEIKTIENKNKQIDASSDLATALQNEINNLSLEITELKTKLDISLDSSTDLIRKNNLLQAEAQSLEGQIISLNQLNDSLESDNQALKQSISSLQLDFGATSLPSAIKEKEPAKNKITKKEIEPILDLSRNPKIIKTIDPKYPRSALQRRINGSVQVIFDVDRSGNTTNIRIKSSTNKLFDSEAMRVIRSSKFEPALNSKGIPTYYFDLTRTYGWEY
jgi:TonB family protein